MPIDEASTRRPASPGRRSAATAPCKRHRVGRGQAGGHHRVGRHTGAQGAADGGRAGRRRQAPAPATSGAAGLAVGAGDGQHLQPALGWPWKAAATSPAGGAFRPDSAATRGSDSEAPGPRPRLPPGRRRHRRPALAGPGGGHRHGDRASRRTRPPAAGGGCRCAAGHAHARAGSGRRRRVAATRSIRSSPARQPPAWRRSAPSRRGPAARPACAASAARPG
jgi:hypothetical protein